MVFAWFPYGFPKFSYGFPMVFLWFSGGFPPKFLWFSNGFPTVFLFFPYGFPMMILWFSYGFPTVFLWLYPAEHIAPKRQGRISRRLEAPVSFEQFVWWSRRDLNRTIWASALHLCTQTHAPNCKVMWCMMASQASNLSPWIRKLNDHVRAVFWHQHSTP